MACGVQRLSGIAILNVGIIRVGVFARADHVNEDVLS